MSSSLLLCPHVLFVLFEWDWRQVIIQLLFFVFFLDVACRICLKQYIASCVIPISLFLCVLLASMRYIHTLVRTQLQKSCFILSDRRTVVMLFNPSFKGCEFHKWFKTIYCWFALKREPSGCSRLRWPNLLTSIFIPPLRSGQDVTQGLFLKGVKLVWIQSFLSPKQRISIWWAQKRHYVLRERHSETKATLSKGTWL